MGRKVHPIGMRLGINQGWQGRWFAEGTQYREQLHQDFAIRSLLQGTVSKGGSAKDTDVRKLRKDLPDTVKNGKAGISRIEVERYPGKVRVAIHTAKPGILIGRKGEGVKKIRHALETLVGKKVDLDIKEISSPDTDAMLVARNVADQLERRIAYRRAMKRAIQQAMRQGAKGIKIMVGGRLGGAEMSRDVTLRDGRVPLQTLRANLDFAKTEASTTYGQLGVKVWVYKGEAVPETEEKAEATEGVYVSEEPRNDVAFDEVVTMLMPKRVKWRKQMRGRMRGKALRGAEVSFGEYGLQALEPGWVTARQIEAARRTIVREMKRRGKVWIRIFPAKPYTHKPPETRMGSGKGNVEYYVAVVKPGRIMFEVGGLDSVTALQALKNAQYKFSIKTKIVARLDAGEQG